MAKTTVPLKPGNQEALPQSATNPLLVLFVAIAKPTTNCSFCWFGRGKVHTSPQQSSWKKVEASIVQHLNKSGSLDNMVTLTFISWTLYRLDTAGKE